MNNVDLQLQGDHRLCHYSSDIGIATRAYPIGREAAKDLS